MTVSAAELAAYLAANRRDNFLLPRRPGESIPLSPSQEQIWLHGLLEPELPLYNETISVSYSGLLDAAALEQSLLEIARRHEIWRTNIRLVDGVPCQFISADAIIPFENLSLLNLARDLREEEARRLAMLAARRPFDLAGGPLLRALVIRIEEQHYRIFLTLHHLIFDGVSIRHVFLPELIELYAARLAERAHTLAPVELQYADYACWQRHSKAQSSDSSLQYWRSQLADLPILKLPTDRHHSPRTSHRGAVHCFAFSPALTAASRQFSQRERSTLFHVMCASLSLVLSRYSGERDVPLGTMTAGRTHSELESMLGYFLNTLILRVDLAGDPSFRELVSRVSETTVSALSHADLPFQDIVRELAKARTGGEPMVRVAFSLQPPLETLPPEWDLDVFEISNGTAKFDLHVELEEGREEIFGRAIYKTDLFDASTIESLVNHWSRLLEAALHHPTLPVWALPMLSEGEMHWLVDELNQTQMEYPQLCLPQLFARQAAKAPHRIAVGQGEQTLTYRELDRRSTQLANYLATQCAGAQGVIALMVTRSPEMLVALLAILKTGAAYVPLDPNYPRERLASMLRDSGADLLITQLSLRGSLPQGHPPVLELDSQRSMFASQPSELMHGLEDWLDRSAYIIFTSGSTGEPKGVEISHRSLTNLLCSMKREPGMVSEDILFAVTSLCFDISALELFLPLICGARVEIASLEQASDPVLLQAALLQSRATIMQATPVTWRMLINNGWQPSEPVKVLCGGEAMTQNLAAELLLRSASVWNMYGPTETTVWSSCCLVTDAGAPISLGKPIANTTLLVLDAYQAPVPVGAVGELYIGGDGLAKGYWKNPDATARQFQSVKVAGGGPRRMYRTGDRVIRCSDGSISFVGRVDKQVKLHGFRIELGEVEQAIRRLPHVQDSVVVKVCDEGRDDVLVAYVIPEAGASFDPVMLRHQVSERLPAYMRPAIFVDISQVPLTPNGKLDRGKLPDPWAHLAVSARQAPRPGAEQVIASIWCDLLQVKTVGRDEDFFELGGHSLLAARLLTKVENYFRWRPSLAAFIQGPTIAHLALGLAGAQAPSARVLKSGSSRLKHLVWIGAAAWLQRLARNLADDQSLLTLTIPPELLSSYAPDYQMEKMAASLADQLCELQPEGPYYLGGFCKEALLAYEVAQQLRHQGKEVALLVLGDVSTPSVVKRTLSQLFRMRVRREIALLTRVRPRHFLSLRALGLLRGRLSAVAWYLERRKWNARSGSEKDDLASVPATLTQALFIAEMKYCVKAYPGKTLFFEARRDPRLPGWRTSAGWSQLVENLEVFTYPGEHMDLHKDPSLTMAARRLQAAMLNPAESELSIDSHAEQLASAL